VSTPLWQRLGFLTPDALEAQQEVWALQARLRLDLAQVHEGLAERSAEPSWGASLGAAATNARALAEALLEEAGEPAREVVGADDLLDTFGASVAEVTASGHAPSLLVMGYVVLGELGELPVRLLAEVAGPHSAILCGRILDARADHALLARLHDILGHDDRALKQLRKLVQHLTRQLADVYGSWRQTFHTLGVDGEWLAEQGAQTLRRAHHELGLAVTRTDLRAFSP